MNPELPWPAQDKAERAWPELLALVADAATALNRAEVAGDLDVRLSTLNNILTDRDRHALKAKQLLYFVLRDERVIRWLADFAGFDVERKKRQTPEEELRELKAKIRDRLGDVGRELLGEPRYEPEGGR